MRGKIRILFFILFLIGLTECATRGVSEIGSEFFTKATFDISYVDSLTLKVSTAMGDSIATSTSTRLLVGYHQDDKLGSVTSQAVFQVGISTPIMLDPKTTEYQSLKVYLKRDKYSFYDTIEEQTLHVYQLTKLPTLWSGFMYNSSKFYINESTPLASATFLPRPRKGDSLEIPLPDAMGLQFMKMAWTNDFRFQTNDEFVKFFKGLAILPDTANSRSFLGIRSDKQIGPEVRLYYHDNSTTPGTDRYIRFTQNGGVYYNKVHSWRASTPLITLKKSGDMVNSVDTYHEGYFQGGVGLTLRVEIPYLRTLLFEDRGFQVTRAYLELLPVNTAYNTDPLPSALTVYAVNEQNKLLSTTGTAGRLITDLDLGRNTRYQVDITSFVNSQIQNDAVNHNALLVLLDDATFRSSVNRLYFGDKINTSFGMRIKLYYLTLPNQSN